MPYSSSILVIGSANMDLVIQSPHFPRPGETILGGKFSTIPGGKGANQAVAAARMGGQVCFISRLGKDEFGKSNLENYQHEGIDTSLIKLDEAYPTGVALITVDQKGENTIIVAPGANQQLSVAEIMEAERQFEKADVILLQLEIPLNVVGASLKIAKELGKKQILNPAPATSLPLDFLEGLYLITPNETEIELLTGIKVSDEKTANQAAKALVDKGVQNVIITLGAEGAYVYSEEFSGMMPTQKVKAIDSTAAGDTFNGALAVALGEGNTLKEAVRFALKAATISVQRMGAQSSIPNRAELA